MEKYKKIKIVGKGNFGHAVLVQASNDHKYYIMKIIDVTKMDHKQKEEAVTEVQVLKEMRHPYIVAYHESFIDKHRCLCIVMDFADGGDLYTKIAQRKKMNKLFPEEQVVDWFLQMALALKHIHSRRILHRDLKTQNIFLTSKGEVKIGDFGIARILQHTYDLVKTAIGTPYYLSPEICQEKPYNQKSDIWSLGCILYELLTLRHAFDANSMKGLVLKILRGIYPPISSTYSEEIRNLVAELLTKDPSKRPTIREILEKPFLKSRINDIIFNTITKYELGSTPGKSKNTSEEESQKTESKVSDTKLKNILLPSPIKGEEEAKIAKGTGKKTPTPTVPDGSKDNFGNEEEKYRVYPTFLTPSGQRLPGLSDHDTIGYRIEALRLYLEKQLGEKEFMALYSLLQEEKDSEEETNTTIRKTIGEVKEKFIPLVYQLIVCEDNYYSNH